MTYNKNVPEDELDEANEPFSPYTNRPPMNQTEFDTHFGYNRPQKCRTLGRKLATTCMPPLSSRRWFDKFRSFFPILTWLPRYNVKQDLLADILGGITIGVTHVPQGIAYAYLAGVPPIIGLYTSLFPSLWYMIFGTSRHNSVGSFAVVSLMCGAVVARECPPPTDPTSETCAIHVASTLAFLVGLIHIVMAFLRLEIVTTYFSDQVVAGFTMASGVHVFVAQLRQLFGLPKTESRTGAFYLFLKLKDIIFILPSANLVTVAISVTSLGFLAVGKEVINPIVQNRFHSPAPIPFELILVILATAIAYLFGLHKMYDINIVEDIPIGFPSLNLPDFDKMPSMLTDAVSIAFVVLAIHISLGMMFAKKLKYTIDNGQEIYALGFCSTLSAFFPIQPVSCSLGRTLVAVDAGAKTQLSTVSSSVFLLFIIVYAGQWLTTLPLAVLAAIVSYALKGMYKKFHELATLWPLSKVDFSIWLVSFTVTVVWDVTPGLVVSIVYALMTTVFRTQFPRWHFLGSLPGSNDFRDSERYRDAMQHKGICIFRFDSPLLFTNVENFKKSVLKSLNLWLSQPSNDITHSDNVYPADMSANDPEERPISQSEITGDGQQSPFAGIVYRHFIVDCSGFTFVDYMGVNALKEIFTEMKQKRVLVYFAAAKAPVRESFEQSGFYQSVPKHNFYPTIRDAVAIARKRRNASTLHLLNEFHAEHDSMERVVRLQRLD